MPLGKPEQDKAIALLKVPDWAAAVTVTFPDPPATIVMDDGFVPNDTVVLAAQFDVNLTAPDIWLVMLGFPTACTNNV
jgi:hypothetical protein